MCLCGCVCLWRGRRGGAGGSKSGSRHEEELVGIHHEMVDLS